CINVLAADQKSVCDQFAKPGMAASIGWRAGVTGSPVLEGVLAYIDCDLEAEHDAGDHLIAVGRVRDIRILDAAKGPLLFFRGGYGGFSALGA
ncbi:MAG: flavin reductase, partial [Gammaproteobacteria bacterium]|nr:flavin reductase [Gammaproteobacteria bacterium]